MTEPAYTRRGVLRTIGSGSAVGSLATLGGRNGRGDANRRRNRDRQRWIRVGERPERRAVSRVGGGPRVRLRRAHSPDARVGDRRAGAQREIRYVEEDRALGGIVTPRRQPRRQGRRRVPYGVAVGPGPTWPRNTATPVAERNVVLDTGIDSTHPPSRRTGERGRVRPERQRHRGVRLPGRPGRRHPRRLARHVAAPAWSERTTTTPVSSVSVRRRLSTP